jgi:hypothetical protein
MGHRLQEFAWIADRDRAREGVDMGVPESPKILYGPAVGKNPVGLCVPLLG